MERYLRSIFLVTVLSLALTGCSENLDKQAIPTESLIPELPSTSEVNLTFLEPGEFSLNSLFESNHLAPSNEKILKKKNEVLKDMTKLELMKSKTAIYNMIESLRGCFEFKNSTNTADESFANAMEIYSCYDPQQLEYMINNLQSISVCMTDENIQKDINTAQKLIQYTLDTTELSGIFYAHHILSDLNYWILDYPFNMEMLDSWDKDPELKESKVFYGLTYTWQNTYPDFITNKIQDIDLSIENKYDLKGILSQKQKSIDATLSSIPKDNLDHLTMLTRELNITLKEALSKSDGLYNKPFIDDVLKNCNKFSTTIDECIKLVPEGTIAEDYKIIKNYFVLFEEKQSIFHYADLRDCILSAQRALQEINQIILTQDIVASQNDFYYGITKTLNDNPTPYDWLTNAVQIDEEEVGTDFLGNPVYASHCYIDIKMSLINEGTLNFKEYYFYDKLDGDEDLIIWSNRAMNNFKLIAFDRDTNPILVNPLFEVPHIQKREAVNVLASAPNGISSLGIYFEDPDGKAHTLVIYRENQALYLLPPHTFKPAILKNDWHVYLEDHPDPRFHIDKIEPIGINDKVLVEDAVLDACLIDSWVYFIKKDLSGIYKVNIRSSSTIKISDTSSIVGLTKDSKVTSEYKNGHIIYTIKNNDSEKTDSKYGFSLTTQTLEEITK